MVGLHSLVERLMKKWLADYLPGVGQLPTKRKQKTKSMLKNSTKLIGKQMILADSLIKGRECTRNATFIGLMHLEVFGWRTVFLLLVHFFLRLFANNSSISLLLSLPTLTCNKSVQLK